MLHLYAVPVAVLVTLNVTVGPTRWVKSAALHCKHESGRTTQNNDCLAKLVEPNEQNVHFEAEIIVQSGVLGQPT